VSNKTGSLKFFPTKKAFEASGDFGQDLQKMSGVSLFVPPDLTRFTGLFLTLRIRDSIRISVCIP
jgi:hypothetical protein